MNQNAFDLEAEMPHGLELYFQMQRTYPSTAYLQEVYLQVSDSFFPFMKLLPLVEDTEVIENVDEAGLYTMASLVLGMTDGGDLI